jgi:hypothetical protein
MALLPNGRGDGMPRIEVARLDELPAGVPAPSGQPDSAKAEKLAKVKRAPKGQVADPESAAILGRLGGLKKAEKDRKAADIPALVTKLGLRDVDAPDFLPYLADAEEFSLHEQDRMARVVGGGTCGNAPASFISSAALQLGASRYCFARGDLAMGSKLANDSRQNLLAAHELCAKEAAARPRSPRDVPWLVASKEPAK